MIASKMIAIVLFIGNCVRVDQMSSPGQHDRRQQYRRGFSTLKSCPSYLVGIDLDVFFRNSEVKER